MLNKCARAKAAASAVYQQRKKVQSFFSNAKNIKLFQQYLKVFIAYMQVLGSFVAFKVKWPGSLGSAIGWVLNISAVIKFDFMELPGLACLWASYSYSYKYYIKMATPLFVALMLGLPLCVAQRMKKRQQAQAQAQAQADRTPTPGKTVDGDVEGDVEADEDKKVDWRVRLSDTTNVFWNNIMFWLFMVYPGTSLAVAQSFICKRIYNQTYLIASMYKDACPWGGLELALWKLDTWSVLAWVSLILVFIYPIGVPLLM